MLSKERFALLREYKASIDVRQVLARYGAHAMGIGCKIRNGEETDTIALRFYVAKKRGPGELTAGEGIPGTISFRPGHSDKRRRLTTDVIETPMARFEEVDPETNVRPVPGGVSGGIVGHTGTIGGWVWDTTDDTIVMLSNHHVFYHTAGVDIIQRGSADGGATPADKIGDVKRGIVRTPVGTNTVDCAIGDPDDSDIYDLSVLEIGAAVYGIEVPVEHMLVEKYGQTTRHTFGEITDPDHDGWINGIGGPYWFEDCLYVDAHTPSTDWSDKGDSGALVFSQTPIEDTEIKPVVGLHFAGSGTHGIVCKIQNVFAQLQLTTLCDGAFSALLDSLVGIEVEAEAETEARLETLTMLAARRLDRFSPHTLIRKEREMWRYRRAFAGISRDMQKRLMTSERGCVITDFVNQNRAELLTLFAKNGDVRRASLSAIRPLVSGAVTTTEVLERKVTDEDLQRLERLSRELQRTAGPKLREDIEKLRALKPKSGVTIAKALEMDL